MAWKANEIRILREHLGLSQREFAKQLGVSHNLIWYWEKDRKSPTKELIEKISLFQKENADDLVNQQEISSEVDSSRVDKVDNENWVDNSEVDQKSVNPQESSLQKENSGVDKLYGVGPEVDNKNRVDKLEVDQKSVNPQESSLPEENSGVDKLHWVDPEVDRLEAEVDNENWVDNSEVDTTSVNPQESSLQEENRRISSRFCKGKWTLP
jgi:transcriptional regulator with XRE-family HTH domain